jgi:hypothetical protein
MLTEKKWIRIVITLLTLNLFLVFGCREKNTQEKMTEQVLKKATGKDVDVKINEGKVQIVDKDSRTEIAETTTWPADLSEDVPKFTTGKIQRVVKSQEQGDSWSFNIYLTDFSSDDIKDYENDLKGKDWQTEIMQMGDKGGYLNGQKGTMGINFMFNLEKKDGMLAVFNRP